MARRFFASVIVVGLAGTATAQTVEFEAASVRVNHSEGAAAGMRLTGGQLTIMNVPLERIVSAAFGINEERMSSLLAGPGWMPTERYDISAKLPPGAVAAQLQPMLQALLRTRFGMSFHRESRELPAYALVVAKGMKASLAAAGSPVGFRIRPGHMESQSTTMMGLTDKLSRVADRPVVDRTGLAGAYAVVLDWAPDPVPNDSDARASLYTAIEEQLGLKLEARKEPMEVVVIDRIEKVPTAD